MGATNRRRKERRGRERGEREGRIKIQNLRKILANTHNEDRQSFTNRRFPAQQRIARMLAVSQLKDANVFKRSDDASALLGPQRKSGGVMVRNASLGAYA
jgi:hypothetical protein